MSNTTPAKQNFYELYRRSTVGEALTDSLDELLQNQYIDQNVYSKILTQFDKSLSEALSTGIKTKSVIKGKLHTFRFCDSVWTFIVDNAEFKSDSETTRVDRVKIVACDGNVTETPNSK
ncbi:transcription initiation factor IIA gamma chain [Tieghemostelium lacteum]|uniref:Transcription initiation factor IIA subunit 2 n=1 Tax=Tieghemostelium lacteum TaxID=361077 RepID=A0A151ZH44_TIELA|nr:transcription initiation factor IIA gamma chain [Tieghemostelium lacteum]|eukprot:KYQ93286.1 transcription initiation factor IIA gamma chain [Tieghemostelium lacteum]